ncbi:MAG: hypothetical protein P4M07_18305 [Xanthobacteraceae bacterium]|nr:hypothetical protein [Xanthobacteraceae bacterium]
MSIATPQAYVIEVQSRSAGIVVRQGHRFYFHAAAEPFVVLEGRPFKSPQHAQQAAIERLRQHAGHRAA